MPNNEVLEDKAEKTMRAKFRAAFIRLFTDVLPTFAFCATIILLCGALLAAKSDGERLQAEVKSLQAENELWRASHADLKAHLEAAYEDVRATTARIREQGAEIRTMRGYLEGWIARYNEGLEKNRQFAENEERLYGQKAALLAERDQLAAQVASLGQQCAPENPSPGTRLRSRKPIAVTAKGQAFIGLNLEPPMQEQLLEPPRGRFIAGLNGVSVEEILGLPAEQGAASF